MAYFEGIGDGLVIVGGTVFLSGVYLALNVHRNGYCGTQMMGHCLWALFGLALAGVGAAALAIP